MSLTRTIAPVLFVSLGISPGVACAHAAHAAERLPKPALDLDSDLRAKPGTLHTAVLAGGCFWCMEAVFEQLKGVTEVTSGFAGGTKESAIYHVVGEGGTGHAESVRITYDPSRITYGTLLWVFFNAIDPTTKEGQRPDFGHQYRSAVFYAGEPQKRVAEAYVRQLEAARVLDAPIATTLEPLDARGGFFPAEAYHQGFVRNHPDHPYVRAWSVPKIMKVRALFPELLAKP